MALVLALGACGNGDDVDVAPLGCDVFCDDGDLCTEDFCDTSLGRCVFVPRDAELACRTDLHCDDGFACSSDRCEVDDCGLQRCNNVSLVGCTDCGGPEGCMPDGDACSVDRCEDEACTHVLDPTCEPRCGPDFVSTDPDETRVTGRVVPAVPCTNCPCATGLAIETATGKTPIATIGSEGGSCTAACDGDQLGYDCRPLVYGVDYVVWGQTSEGRLEAAGWCPTTQEGLMAGTYLGSLRFDDGTVVPLEVLADAGSPSARIHPLPCGCDVEIFTPEVHVSTFETFGRTFTLEVFGGERELAMLEVRLTPRARGWRGAVLDGISGALVGEVELELELGPRY